MTASQIEPQSSGSQNRLAEARYELTHREQKLVLYVISMIEPEDEFFKLHKITLSTLQRSPAWTATPSTRNYVSGAAD